MERLLPHGRLSLLKALVNKIDPTKASVEDDRHPATLRTMLMVSINAVPRKVRRMAIVVNILALAATVVASFLATPIYRSEALLVPKSSLGGGGPDISVNAQAALAGLGLSGGNTKLAAFEAIIKSNAVLDLFIQKSGIKEEVKREYIEDYRDVVSNQFLIDVRKDGTITIAAEHKDPAVAKRYLSEYIAAFDEVTRSIAVRNSRIQADMLERVVEQARSSYGAAADRLQDAPVDSTIIRADPAALSHALTTIETRILEGRILISRLEKQLATNNPDLVSAKRELALLIAERDRLVSTKSERVLEGKDSKGGSSYPLDSALSRQHAVIVGVYTQAREKMLFDAIMAASPYATAQTPTLPEKRVRPQRRKMIAFSLMVQALLTLAVFGAAATLHRIRIPANA